jgi:hypothetical protein
MVRTTRNLKTTTEEAGLLLAAEKFANGAKTWATIQKVTSSRDAFVSVQKDPEAFFAAQGAKLPKGLMLEVFAHPPRQLPGPDWTPFVIELSACRTFWVRVCDDSTPPKCEFRQETVCFGIRVRPRFPPMGPIPPIAKGAV